MPNVDVFFYCKVFFSVYSNDASSSPFYCFNTSTFVWCIHFLIKCPINAKNSNKSPEKLDFVSYGEFSFYTDHLDIHFTVVWCRYSTAVWITFETKNCIHMAAPHICPLQPNDAKSPCSYKRYVQ